MKLGDLMNLLHDMMTYNKQFVAEKKYEKYYTNKYPDKRMVILTCMDTRLTVLLPKALNLKNGDVKIVKNAGALVTHPFGSVMRSLLVSVYELQADEIFVIGHHDCGMGGFRAEGMIDKMKSRGIKEETLETLEYAGIEFKEWLKGFNNVTESVSHSVDVIKNHPLLPVNIPVHGLVIDPTTGKLDIVMDGYLHETHL